MVLMKKDNEKKFVPDIFVESYKANGYTIDGENPEKEHREENDGENGDFDDEVKYVCPHCNKEYKSEKAFNKHLETHSNSEN